MNKQRNMLTELLLIGIVIICASVIIWNINPFSSSPAKTISQKTDAESSTGSPPKTTTPKDEKWMKGKSLFKANCASCHNPKVAQTGPALIGVTKRWQDAGSYHGKSGEQWLHVWIKNWNEAVASGYPYAVNIQHYNETAMNVFTNLSDDDINDILHYVETYGDAPTSTLSTP